MKKYPRNPVHWFEIPVSDMTRATHFYETTLGIQFDLPLKTEVTELSLFPMEQDADGSPGALVKSDGQKPTTGGTVVFFQVDSVERLLKNLEAAGGRTIYTGTQFEQFGSKAYLEDSEGNKIGLIETV